MLRAIVMLAAALALFACGDLDFTGRAERAADSGPSADTAGTTAPPAGGVAEVRPASPSAGSSPAAPPQSAPVQTALAPPPASAPPAIAPRPASAACAELSANGPAREVDLDAVRRALRGTDYRRGPAESNNAYRSRLLAKLAAVEALVVEQTGRPDLVFSLPIPAYRLTYDGDRHELWVGSELGLLRGGSAIGMGDFILVSSSERQVGSHLATIAYGARGGPGIQQEVAKITGDQLGIILPGGSSMGWPTNYARFHVPMTPGEAAAAKQAFAVLFVGHLQEPYFITGEFIQEPKLGDPVDKHLTVEALKIAVDCAAVYDRRSGRLIRQILPAAG
jgi:hypothetical protein